MQTALLQELGACRKAEQYLHIHGYFSTGARRWSGRAQSNRQPHGEGIEDKGVPLPWGVALPSVRRLRQQPSTPHRQAGPLHTPQQRPHPPQERRPERSPPRSSLGSHSNSACRPFCPMTCRSTAFRLYCRRTCCSKRCRRRSRIPTTVRVAVGPTPPHLRYRCARPRPRSA